MGPFSPKTRVKVAGWRVQFAATCPDALRAAAATEDAWRHLSQAGRMLHANPLIGSQVSAAELAGQPLVVKRRDYVGLRRRWRMARRGTSAAREFVYSQMLTRAGVATPPVYLLAESNTWLPRSSVLVFQRIENSRTLMEALADQPRGRACRELLDQSARFVAGLFDQGLYYGDLHPGNVLVGPAVDGRLAFYLIDLTEVSRAPAADPGEIARLVGRFVLRCAEPDAGGPWLALRWLARFSAECRSRPGWPAASAILWQARLRRARYLRRVEQAPQRDWRRVKLPGGRAATLNARLSMWPTPAVLAELVARADRERRDDWIGQSDPMGRSWWISPAEPSQGLWADWCLNYARWMAVPRPVACISGQPNYWVAVLPPAADGAAPPGRCQSVAWQAAVCLARLRRWGLTCQVRDRQDWLTSRVPGGGDMRAMLRRPVLLRVAGSPPSEDALIRSLADAGDVPPGDLGSRLRSLHEPARRWVALWD